MRSHRGDLRPSDPDWNGGFGETFGRLNPAYSVEKLDFARTKEMTWIADASTTSARACRCGLNSDS
jgi:hypothetical protein